jgi:hypothetical protein
MATALLALQTQVEDKIPLLFGGFDRYKCLNTDELRTPLDPEPEQLLACNSVLESFQTMCENSEFCKRHSNNWTLMQEELAGFLKADHFPHTEEEIQQFFVSSTVDAAILFHINYLKKRPQVWEIIFEDPLKWSELYIFTKMKSSIKSIRRFVALQSLRISNCKKTPKECLRDLISSLGGLAKAKECFTSNCDISLEYSNLNVDQAVYRIIVASSRNIFQGCITHIYKPFKESIEQHNETAIEAAMNAWRMNMSSTEASAREFNTGNTLTLVKLMPAKFGTYEDLFNAKYLNTPILLGLCHIFTGKHPFVDEPYVGINEQESHLKSGDKIIPWIAYQFKQYITIPSETLGLTYYPSWQSNKAILYQELVMTSQLLSASDRRHLRSFCIASQILVLGKEMINQGIISEELSYEFSKNESLHFIQGGTSVFCPAMKLTNLHSLRDLEEIGEYIPKECIPLDFLNRYFYADCKELSSDDKEFSMLQSVMAYAMTDLKCLDRTFPEESEIFTAVKIALNNKTASFDGFTVKRIQGGEEGAAAEITVAYAGIKPEEKSEIKNTGKLASGNEKILPAGRTNGGAVMAIVFILVAIGFGVFGIYYWFSRKKKEKMPEESHQDM